MRVSILLACLVLGILAMNCEREELKQEDAIRELGRRITEGMSRDEIEVILEEMGLRYVYVPRSLLEAMHQATFESTPLSGRIQVSLPEDKGLLSKAVGEVLIDLDEDERMVNLGVQRQKVPR